MKRAGPVIIATLVLGLIVTSFVGGCTPTEATRLKVVTTTSLLAQIVERVGGEKVDVVNIIPPAQCPGHFDVKPGDIQKLADADLFLMHGWQGEMFTQELIASANNSKLTAVKIDVMGNWLVPSVQQQAADNVTAVLCQLDTRNSATYQRLLAEYKDKIKAKEDEIKARLSKEDLASINVMCADQLSEFVQWVGFKVVAVYGRPESLTPQIVKELVDKGKQGEVFLIIENMQSGADAGKGVAEELGCRRIILSNFPGGYDNTETWEKAIDYDLELMLGAIKR